MPEFDKAPQSFDEFWPYYLSQHEQPATRQMHIAGTGVAIASLMAFAITKRPAFLASALVGSYGPAWLSHATLEHNKPATFDFPLWSLLGDLKMFGLWAQGRLEDELPKAHARLVSNAASRESGNSRAATARANDPCI